MIDTTKPLELVDGRPVTFMGVARDGDIRVRLPGGDTRYFMPSSGKHRYGEAPNLRNVASVIDFSKPIEFVDGTPATADLNSVATFRSGGLKNQGGRGVRVFGDKTEIVYYLDDGTAPHSPALHIRNVVAPAVPKLDLTAPLQTRDGRPVRLLATDAKGYHPVVYMVAGELMTATANGFTTEARFRGLQVESTEDLVNVPPKPVVKTMFYSLGDGYTSAASASSTYGSRWDVLEVTTTDGVPTATTLIKKDAINAR